MLTLELEPTASRLLVEALECYKLQLRDNALGHASTAAKRRHSADDIATLQFLIDQLTPPTSPLLSVPASIEEYMIVEDNRGYLTPTRPIKNIPFLVAAFRRGEKFDLHLLGSVIRVTRADYKPGTRLRFFHKNATYVNCEA